MGCCRSRYSFVGLVDPADVQFAVADWSGTRRFSNAEALQRWTHDAGHLLVKIDDATVGYIVRGCKRGDHRTIILIHFAIAYDLMDLSCCRGRVIRQMMQRYLEWEARSKRAGYTRVEIWTDQPCNTPPIRYLGHGWTRVTEAGLPLGCGHYEFDLHTLRV